MSTQSPPLPTVTWHEQALTPSKVVCVGRNYVEHIQELNNPMPGELVLFHKPSSSISDTLICPQDTCRYETEITFLIQKQAPVAVGLGLDLTLVEVQQRLKQKSLPWEKAKAFDGSAVFTHFVDLPDTLDTLWLRLSIDGEVKQEGGVSLMIHSPAQILEEAQRHFRFYDNDLLMTGTPKGVGPLIKGATFVAELWDGDSQLLTHTWHVS